MMINYYETSLTFIFNVSPSYFFSAPQIRDCQPLYDVFKLQAVRLFLEMKNEEQLSHIYAWCFRELNK